MSAIEKLETRMQKANSLLCVGLDADINRIPARFANDQEPQFAFNRWIIDQTHDLVCAYKPNMAFYEARGADGLRDLQNTMAYLHEHHPDIFTICDAKRADIGNTNSGYVAGIFDRLGFDAITLHPYLGEEALAPFLERDDKACVILCRTSNPGAPEFQDLAIDGQPLWEHVAVRVRDDWNRHNNCMLVIGGTYPADLKRAREIAPDMPFLVPGVGAQSGNAVAVVQAGCNTSGGGLVINSSRGILFAADPQQAATQLRDTINAG